MKSQFAQVGTIDPPNTIPTAGANPEAFIASLIRNGIQLLLIVGFIIFFLWTMFAGFRFITSGGDPKNTSAAWGQIYWGLIGIMVVLGSFAIIKLVETFFKVTIISGGFNLPGL